jgi:hypothetical protein
VAASDQRPPGRRPVPVATDTGRLRQCAGRTPGVRTPAAVFGSSGGQRRLAACSSAADRTPAPRPPSSRPDGIARWPQLRKHLGHLAVSAGGGLCPLPQAADVHGRSATGDHRVPPCSGAAAVPAMRPGCGRVLAGRPLSTPDTAALSAEADTCWGYAPGRVAGGQRQCGRSDSGRGWWTPAAAGARRCGHRRRRQRRADPTATPRWTAGSTTVHRHPRCPTRNRTEVAAAANAAMA